jgi:hypothetical protein
MKSFEAGLRIEVAVENSGFPLAIITAPVAGMAELADAADSKSADLRVLGVRLPLPAPSVQTIMTQSFGCRRCCVDRGRCVECGFIQAALSLAGLLGR